MLKMGYIKLPRGLKESNLDCKLFFELTIVHVSNCVKLCNGKVVFEF